MGLAGVKALRRAEITEYMVKRREELGIGNDNLDKFFDVMIDDVAVWNNDGLRKQYLKDKKEALEDEQIAQMEADLNARKDKRNQRGQGGGQP